ncbi:helix-turn-helix transcriptional regulator [Neolewinella litorea]|uniref:AraC family transcriptional regulator n=1 Tax=Neolewinella litorea TaxID=2562452 RepID=A0A4S4NMR1_9BACT|nr:helix-turn-helix transcriptional regulator [Neolewinella litorea]THH39671.1 AraC family transcriptional regulator [Neolewinella litorea]
MCKPHTVYIENMVCDRCKMAVRQVVTNLGWRIESLELGRLTAVPPEPGPSLEPLSRQLSGLGFSLRRDAGGVVSRIKGIIIAYVYDDLADSTVPLSDLITKDIGQSYPHLSRVFRREEGRTIADYYRVQRMERARQLLVTTDEQIALIAYRLHYGTGGRFTTAFKEATGLCPREFRERGVYQPRPLDEL